MPKRRNIGALAYHRNVDVLTPPSEEDGHLRTELREGSDELGRPRSELDHRECDIWRMNRPRGVATLVPIARPGRSTVRTDAEEVLRHIAAQEGIQMRASKGIDMQRIRGLLAIAGVMLPFGPAVRPAHAAVSGYSVAVGYADTLRANAPVFSPRA